MATSPLQNARLISEATVKTMLNQEQHLIVNEQVTMNTATGRTYKLNTLLGTAASQYDLTTVDIQAFVLDNESGSATNGYFIEGSPVIAAGFKTDGTCYLYNNHSASLTVRVRIRVSKKAPT